MNYQLSVLALVLMLGVMLIILSHYRAPCFWRQTRFHRATLVQGMAIIVVAILRQSVNPKEHDHQVREMRHFLPLSTRGKETFKEHFGVPLFNNYGLTEYLIGAVTDFPHGERHWSSTSKVGPGYKIRIVGDKGSNLPESEVGELVLYGVLGVSLMTDYWDNPKATTEILGEDGWYHARDYAYVEDGWVYFMGRHTDPIRHSGESVSSVEVEGAIEGLPGVCEIAVIDVLDGIRGQAVKALIVTEASATPDAGAVIDYCAGRLITFKVPSFVKSVEELPWGSYGKIQKHIPADS